MARKNLYKNNKNKIIAGILGGLGEYYNIDPTILRLGWIVVCILTGLFPGLLAYFIAMLIVPKKP